MELLWHPFESGRYYIHLERTYYDSMMEDSLVSFCVSCEIPDYTADISGIDGIGAKDGKVDIYDLEAMTACWLEPCLSPDWCMFADINQSGKDDLQDISILASQWLSGELQLLMN
jgi:hypothetical protein